MRGVIRHRIKGTCRLNVDCLEAQFNAALGFLQCIVHSAGEIDSRAADDLARISFHQSMNMVVGDKPVLFGIERLGIPPQRPLS